MFKYDPETIYMIIDKLSEENNEKVDEFLSYFERMFIASSEEKPPIYSISFWNGYNRVLNNITRTSNGCEGFHRVIINVVGVSRPNIARLITNLQKLDEISRLKFEQMKIGKIYRLKNIDYEYEFYLRNAMNNYELFHIENYLNLLRKIIKWKTDDEE